MFKTLFKREILSSSFLAKKGKDRVLSILLDLIFLSIFVALICFVYYRMYEQLEIYSGFNRSLFSFVIFFVFVIGTILSLQSMLKCFFGNEKEKIILGSRPVPKKIILLSKTSFCTLKNVLFLCFSYLPLSIIFGVQSNISGVFYFVAILFLPLFAILLSALSLVLLIPFREVALFLKKHPLIAFLLTIAISFLLAYLYSLFLNLFVTLVQNSSLDLLFNSQRMETMTAASRYLAPVCFLVSSLLFESGLSFLYFLLIILGLSAIGITCMYFYLEAYYRSNTKSGADKDYFIAPIEISNPTYALVKKELSLVLSRSDGFFSFVSLVAVEPFLIYLVVSAINIIFNTGNLAFIQTLFPDFLLFVDCLLILLFLSVINSTSSLSLKKEGRNMITMKVLPVDPRKQLLIKMAVPFSFSAFSYLVSLIVLFATGQINGVSFGFLIPIGFIFLTVLSFSTIHLDMRMKKGDLISLLVDFLLPVVFLLISFALTLIPSFSNYAFIAFYCSLLILLILLLSPLVLLFVLRTPSLFLKYQGGETL